MPGAGSNPAIGQPDKLEVVEEEQIQVVIPLEHARDVIQAMIKAHPYEVPAYDLVPIWTIEEL